MLEDNTDRSSRSDPNISVTLSHDRHGACKTTESAGQVTSSAAPVVKAEASVGEECTMASNAPTRELAVPTQWVTSIG